MLLNVSSIRMAAASRIQNISRMRKNCGGGGCQENIPAPNGRSSFSFHCDSASISQAWKHRWDHRISLSCSEVIKKILYVACLLGTSTLKVYSIISASGSIQEVAQHVSELLCCVATVEGDWTKFRTRILTGSTTRDSSKFRVKDFVHVNSARVLQRLKLTIWILLHRRQREKVVWIHSS